jgi:hypothetical protein
MPVFHVGRGMESFFIDVQMPVVPVNAVTTPAPGQIWKSTRRANRYVLIRGVDDDYVYARACGPRDGTAYDPDACRATQIRRTPTGVAQYVLHLEVAPPAQWRPRNA